MNITTAQNEQIKLHKDHKLIIDNRKKVIVTAVNKAVSANPNAVIFALNKNKIIITGINLNITKLDGEQGNAEVEGDIIGVKYSSNIVPQNFLKRIFK